MMKITMKVIVAPLGASLMKKRCWKSLGRRSGSFMAKGSESINKLLRTHFSGIGNKRGDITVQDFRKQIKQLLEQTDVSDADINRLIEILDTDGSDTISWSEFVSCISYPRWQMRELVRKLRREMQRQVGTSGDHSAFFRKLAKGRKGNAFISPKAMQEHMHRFVSCNLTPGEAGELFRVIDTDNNKRITQAELENFLKGVNDENLFEGGNLDDECAIVDIAISTNKTEEDNFRTMHYKRINVNLNEGSIGMTHMYIWYKADRLANYSSVQEFRSKCITDIKIAHRKLDTDLTILGFRCMEKSLSTGALLQRKQYIWVKYGLQDNPRGKPVLNIAATVGRAKEPTDPIHFPPFHGFKRVRAISTLVSEKMFSCGFERPPMMRIRQLRAGTGHPRGRKRGKEETKARVAERVRAVVRQKYPSRKRLEEAFREFDTDSSGVLSRQQFKRAMHRNGINIDNKDMSNLLKALDADRSGTIGLQEFFDFLERDGGGSFGPASALMSKLRQNLRPFVDKRSGGNGSLNRAFRRKDAQETGDVKLRDFISVVRSFRTGLSDSDLKQVFMRFDSGRSGTIDYMRFEDFIVMGGTDGNFGYGGSSDAKLLTDVMRKLKSIFSRRALRKNWRSVFADLADGEPDIDLRDFGGILEDELRSEGSERGRKLCKE